jgi:hypothetical protein
MQHELVQRTVALFGLCQAVGEPGARQIMMGGSGILENIAATVRGCSAVTAKINVNVTMAHAASRVSALISLTTRFLQRE